MVATVPIRTSYRSLFFFYLLPDREKEVLSRKLRTDPFFTQELDREISDLGEILEGLEEVPEVTLDLMIRVRRANYPSRFKTEEGWRAYYDFLVNLKYCKDPLERAQPYLE
ncbi:MAG: hypothetical protein WCV90_08790 [Candidatus Woesearchaeota archaeon]